VPVMTKRVLYVDMASLELLVQVRDMRSFSDLPEPLRSRLSAWPLGPLVVALEGVDAVVALTLWVGASSVAKLVSTQDLEILQDRLASFQAL
jgi:hypothetical protein